MKDLIIAAFKDFGIGDVNFNYQTGNIEISLKEGTKKSLDFFLNIPDFLIAPQLAKYIKIDSTKALTIVSLLKERFRLLNENGITVNLYKIMELAK